MDLFGYDDLEIRVYDPQTQQVIKTFKTVNGAANYLGLTPSVVRHRCNSKVRVHSPLIEKEVAVRFVNKHKK